MDGRPRTCIGLAALIGVFITLSACSSGKPGGTVIVTVHPSPLSRSPAPKSSASSRVAPPVSMKKLPGTCSDLLPAAIVDNTVNTTLHGKTSFVVGTPDRSIARVGYLNCRFGVTTAPVPAVEIGVSLYKNAARAAARINATVTDFGNHGASAKKVRVGAVPATILTGGNGTGYDVPTLVLSFGQRTVAVSVSSRMPAANRTKNLTALAALALKRTAP
ncbi:MAG: hypothetical protein M3070_18995 [Actinomycetota bacterium]|nr:hypothetical protein [Actinomycetota bacterium]